MSNKVNYEMLNIYDLRNYARRCGVQSPTSKTKGTLIEEIKKINAGTLQPVFEPARVSHGIRKDFYNFLQILREFKVILKENARVKDDSIFDYYQDNLSEFSEIDVVVNINNCKDFVVVFEELMYSNFDAMIEEIKFGLYKIKFDYQTIIISIWEEVI